MKVLIPMAGRGQRFVDAGYTFPKPLIEVFHENATKPMIQMVVDNLNLAGEHIFLAQKEHCTNFALKYLLPLICRENPCKIIEVDGITEGAACTVLLAKEHINNDEELVLANSDQWLDWSSSHFLKFLRSRNADGGICTFFATHPKWSFAKVEEGSSVVTEVAEKKPISNIATCGIYYFKRGRDFVEAAEEMIAANDRTMGEFYSCPAFNYMIKAGKKVLSYPIGQMLGTGTPEDLQTFIATQKK